MRKISEDIMEQAKGSSKNIERYHEKYIYINGEEILDFSHCIKLYKENIIKEKKLDFIDSCSMMYHYGKKLYLVEGPQENIKITTPDDFYSMRAILDARENAQIYGL